MAAQLPDIIFLRGVRNDLYTNPLELYWHRLRKKRPAFHSLEDCKRGYVATWEIKNNQLFLKSVEGNFERKFFFFIKKIMTYSLKILFPKAGNRFVKANWFSGKLRIPQGKMTLYDDDYRSRFEREIIINVNKGDITKMVTLDNMQRVLIVNAQLQKRSSV